MDRDEVWRAIDSERRGMADLLQQLAPAEWDHPTLCPGWTVRDIAAHLTLAPETSLRDAVVEYARARGNFNRAIFDSARRKATARPREKLVADLRAIAGSRRLAPGQTHREPLLDILVHGQDIVLPLGRSRPMPVRWAAVSADRVWSMPFPFHARRRLRGFRLAATDTAWSRGDGPLVEGPMEALLLLLTGRTAALGRLAGDGVPGLTERMAARAVSR
jgi:uncharacterized protein (TIGR03083 family)